MQWQPETSAPTIAEGIRIRTCSRTEVSTELNLALRCWSNCPRWSDTIETGRYCRCECVRGDGLTRNQTCLAMRVNTVCTQQIEAPADSMKEFVNLGTYVGPNIEVLRFALRLAASVKVLRYIRSWHAKNVKAYLHTHTCLHRLMHNRTRKQSSPLAAHPAMQYNSQIHQQLHPHMRATDFRRKRCRCGGDSAHAVSQKRHGIDYVSYFSQARIWVVATMFTHLQICFEISIMAC